MSRVADQSAETISATDPIERNARRNLFSSTLRWKQGCVALPEFYLSKNLTMTKQVAKLGSIPDHLITFHPTTLRVALLIILVLGWLPAEGRGDDASRPNIILVMCDDLGWGDVGFNGSKQIKTPHLDKMASNSLRFHRFYAAAPVCSPTRGSALTGRHPFRYGIVTANRGHMKPKEYTLAEALQQKGYATGHFGKWHLGTLTTKIKDANRGGPGSEKIFSPPQQNGFDVCFSTESKVPTFDPMRLPKRFAKGGSRRIGWDSLDEGEPWQAYGTHYWDERGEVVTENLRGDDSKIIMDRAIPFIQASVEKEKPFFAVIWFHTPHLPVVASPKHREMYPGEDLHRRNYFGSVSAMDEQVGRLRAMLRKLNVADETMVWFCSDNGPEGNANSPGSAGPFRGRKRSLYEGGVRVPGLLEWPARITEARTTKFPAVTSDYLPTVFDVVGIEPTDAPQPMDGMSLLGLIDGTMKKRPHPIAFQSGKTATLSDNRYKLVMNNKSNDIELYDLLADPSESDNIAAQHAERAEKMRAELLKFQESCRGSARGDDYSNR